MQGAFYWPFKRYQRIPLKHRPVIAAVEFFIVLFLVALFAALAPFALGTDSAAYAQTDSADALDAPDLKVEAASATAIELSWSKVDDADRYELWTWWDDTNGWQQLDNGDLTATFFIHTGLSAGRKYYYFVSGVRGASEDRNWSARQEATGRRARKPLHPMLRRPHPR